MRRAEVAWAVAVVAVTIAGQAWGQTRCRPVRPNQARAEELAAEAQKQSVVDVEGAIAKLVKAVELDPQNHGNLFALARLYKKKEAWPTAATALESAARLHSRSATYLLAWGEALSMEARSDGKASSWQKARDVLSRCIEVDAGRADCYHERAMAEEYLGLDQQALTDFTKAISLRPSSGRFYAPLADLYLRLNYPKHAEQVVEQGLRFVRDTREEYSLLILTSTAKQQRGDVDGMSESLERAMQIGGDEHPEVLFNLGSTYVVQGKREQGVRLLKSFSARVCRGPHATKYVAACERAQAIIAATGGY